MPLSQIRDAAVGAPAQQSAWQPGATGQNVDQPGAESNFVGVAGHGFVRERDQPVLVGTLLVEVAAIGLSEIPKVGVSSEEQATITLQGIAVQAARSVLIPCEYLSERADVGHHHQADPPRRCAARRLMPKAVGQVRMPVLVREVVLHLRGRHRGSRRVVLKPDLRAADVPLQGYLAAVSEREADHLRGIVDRCAVARPQLRLGPVRGHLLEPVAVAHRRAVRGTLAVEYLHARELLELVPTQRGAHGRHRIVELHRPVNVARDELHFAVSARAGGNNRRLQCEAPDPVCLRGVLTAIGGEPPVGRHRGPIGGEAVIEVAVDLQQARIGLRSHTIRRAVGQRRQDLLEAVVLERLVEISVMRLDPLGVGHPRRDARRGLPLAGQPTPEFIRPHQARRPPKLRWKLVIIRTAQSCCAVQSDSGSP